MASLFESLTNIPKSIFGAGRDVMKRGKKLYGGSFFSGTPDTEDFLSRLTPEQQPLATQAIQSGLGKGAGGAFGTAADYYYNLLGNNPQDFEAFAAPEMRRFREETIPGLSEQFAGMGSGALSSSGFRNAAVGAGTDLAERLGNIRAQLRQNAAQGLMGIGQAGLQQFGEPYLAQGAPGFFESILPFIGQAAGTALAGPAGGLAGGAIGSGGQSWLAQSRKGKSSPYGGGGLT